MSILLNDLINTTNIPLNDTNFFCKVYNYKNINEMNNCHYSALKLNNGNIDFPLVNSITIDNYSNIYEQIYKTLIMLYLRKINYDKDKIITNKEDLSMVNDFNLDSWFDAFIFVLANKFFCSII